VVSYLLNVSKVDEHLRIYDLSRILMPAVNLTLVCTIWFIYIEIEPSNIFFINIIGTAIGISLLIFIFIKKEVLYKQRETDISWGKLCKYGVQIHGTAVLGLLINNFDKIFLLIKGGMVDFGIYTVAFGASRLIGILPSTLSTVIFSKFAGENTEDLSNATRTTFSLIFLPLLLLTIFLAMFSVFLIPFVYGIEYKESVIPFGILLIECTISGVGWILAQRFTAGGKPGLVFVRQIISLLPLLSLFIYMPPYDISIVLSMMMLLGSVIRLLITFFLYPISLNEPCPDIFPKKKDVKVIYEKLMRK
jgi:O-antigen/teichoic acid export membrane protein